jgi:threonine dehydrogenase-like Zn-dependent dehydrogenase
MKAVVWMNVGDIRLTEMPEPKIEEPTDAIVRLTASAICGTDLHMIRGTMSGMKSGTILGHEGVGVVEEVGKDVRTLSVGDRVVICSTVGCGACESCRIGIYSQCLKANPNGPEAGTVFFGGPKDSGPFNGLQAEKARIPYAHITCVKLPDEVSDDQAILLSDIFPTGYQAAEQANIQPGNNVAVFGCGPVGQFAIASAKLLGAGRIFAIDREPTRLDMARAQGAETINFDQEDPKEAIMRLTGGNGADCVIDAVGIDAEHAHEGPAAKQAEENAQQFEQQIQEVAPETHPETGFGPAPDAAPSQVLMWGVECVKKAGTLSIIGVYSPQMNAFPIGKAMNKNLTVTMGNCNHRKYMPMLVDLVRSGVVDPTDVLTQREPLTDVLSAYHAFNERQPGWIKVELEPAA